MKRLTLLLLALALTVAPVRIASAGNHGECYTNKIDTVGVTVTNDYSPTGDRR